MYLTWTYIKYGISSTVKTTPLFVSVNLQIANTKKYPGCYTPAPHQAFGAEPGALSALQALSAFAEGGKNTMSAKIELIQLLTRCYSWDVGYCRGRSPTTTFPSDVCLAKADTVGNNSQ